MLGHQVHVLGVAVDSLAVRGSGGVSRLVPCDVFLGRTHQDATLREQLEPGAHVLAVGHESTSISLASRNPPATIPKTASTSRRNSPKYAHRPPAPGCDWLERGRTSPSNLLAIFKSPVSVSVHSMCCTCP